MMLLMKGVNSSAPKRGKAVSPISSASGFFSLSAWPKKSQDWRPKA